MNWLNVIPLLVSAAGAIKSIIDVANGNEDIITKIQKTFPGLAGIIEEIGGALFPSVKPQLRIAAGAMAAFDPDVTKWLQGSLNVLISPSPNLVVDGIYGPLTRAAVVQVQEQLGLTVDGWAGVLTQAAISHALSQKPVIK